MKYTDNSIVKDVLFKELEIGEGLRIVILFILKFVTIAHLI